MLPYSLLADSSTGKICLNLNLLGIASAMAFVFYEAASNTQIIERRISQIAYLYTFRDFGKVA